MDNRKGALFNRLIRILKDVNKHLPSTYYCEADVHDLLAIKLKEANIEFKHEYYYADNSYKLDFLIEDIGIELKASKGNISRQSVAGLTCYFPLCSRVLFANYAPGKTTGQRFTLAIVDNYQGFQLSYPLKVRSIKHHRVTFIGDYDGKITMRYGWPKTEYARFTDEELRKAMEV